MSKTHGNAASPLIEDTGGSGLQRLIERARTASRRRRSALFHACFEVDASTRILDLGGWDGSHIHALLAGTPATPANVHVADIDANAVEAARRRYGYRPVVLDEDGPLELDDDAFDIVFCSSVLEHVTVPKADVWRVRSGRRFRRQARAAQRRFAEEVSRVSRGYFVQVPCRWYPIETHTWLPFVSYLPRRLQCAVIAVANRAWIKKTDPDFHLPGAAEMRRYFPDAELHRERTLGLTKSLIAVRRPRRN